MAIHGGTYGTIKRFRMAKKCLHKDIILKPELSIFKPEQMEDFKKVTGGQNVTINVKNKEPQTLERTPVIKL